MAHRAACCTSPRCLLSKPALPLPTEPFQLRHLPYKPFVFGTCEPDFAVVRRGMARTPKASKRLFGPLAHRSLGADVALHPRFASALPRTPPCHPWCQGHAGPAATRSATPITHICPTQVDHLSTSQNAFRLHCHCVDPLVHMS